MSERTQQPLPFAHVHAPKAALYRRIMRAFVDAKRRFLVHLRPEDIAQAIQDDSVEGALSALVEWGNLRADPDTSRVTSVEEHPLPVGVVPPSRLPVVGVGFGR